MFRLRVCGDEGSVRGEDLPRIDRVRETRGGERGSDLLNVDTQATVSRDEGFGTDKYRPVMSSDLSVQQ